MSDVIWVVSSFGITVLIAAALALALTLRGWVRLTLVLAMIVTGLSATLLLIAAGEHRLWEGMGAVFVGLFLLAPPAVGLWLGLLVGILIRRQRARRLGKEAAGR